MRSRMIADAEIYAVAALFPEVNFADADGTRALFAAMLKAAAADGGPARDARVA